MNVFDDNSEQLPLYEPHHQSLSTEAATERDVLLNTIRHASNYTLHCLKMELCTMVYKPTYDPMVWLPPELVDKMLKYLDTSALLKIAQLSKPWRRYLLRHSIWRQACLTMNLTPNKHWALLRVSPLHCAFHGAIRAAYALYPTITKTILSCSSPMKNDDYQAVAASGSLVCYVGKTTGTISDHRHLSLRVYNAIHNELVWSHSITVGHRLLLFKDTVNRQIGQKPDVNNKGVVVFDLSNAELQLVYPSSNEASVVVVNFRCHTGQVMDCDLDIDRHLLVSIGVDGLRLWDMFTGVMLRFLDLKNSVAVKLYSSPNEKMICLIATYGQALKYFWSVSPGMSEPQIAIIQKINSAFIAKEETIERLHVFGDYLSIQSELHPISDSNREDYCSNFNSSILMGNNTVSELKIDTNEKRFQLVVYDVYTNQLLHCIDLKEKILNVLAAGRRFAIIMTPFQDWQYSTLKIIDLKSYQTVSQCTLPKKYRRLKTTVGCTGWMDGIPVDACVDHLHDYSAQCYSTQCRQERQQQQVPTDINYGQELKKDCSVMKLHPGQLFDPYDREFDEMLRLQGTEGPSFVGLNKKHLFYCDSSEGVVYIKGIFGSCMKPDEKKFKYD